MSDFSDLVAKAIQPSMTRAEREAVYTVVRQAVLRLQEREALPADDPRVALQRHLVEETIRDVEGDVVRHESLRKLERAFAAQSEAHAAAGRGDDRGDGKGDVSGDAKGAARSAEGGRG